MRRSSKGRKKCKFNKEIHKGIIYEYHTYTFWLVSYAPHLEYSFQIWRAWLKQDIKLLEDFRRRPTKLVKGLSGHQIWKDRDSLSYRMDKGDMTLVQWRNFFQMTNISRLRGHPLKLRNDRSSLRSCRRTLTYDQVLISNRYSPNKPLRTHQVGPVTKYTQSPRCQITRHPPSG